MSDIMRISGDYQRDNDTARAVVGFDTATGEWVVEYGTVREPFNPSSGFIVSMITRHDNDTIAQFASDL